MSEITIPKTEYNLLKDFYIKAKRQIARGRLIQSVKESRTGKMRALTRSQFKKEFGI